VGSAVREAPRRPRRLGPHARLSTRRTRRRHVHDRWRRWWQARCRSCDGLEDVQRRQECTPLCRAIARAMPTALECAGGRSFSRWFVRPNEP